MKYRRTSRSGTNQITFVKGRKMPKSSESFASNADDFRWQDYEELVKDIYQALGQTNGVTVECWGSSCKVEGPPGVFHQIDVLTRHSDGLHQYRTAISCKYWNKKVDISKVRELVSIVQDAGLNKGVIVSKMGFTAGAKTYAEAKNIGLVELRKPVDKDWDGYIRKIHITTMFDQTQIYDVQFRLTAPKPVVGEQVFQGGSLNWTLHLNQIIIGIPGHEAETLQKLTDEEWSKHPDQEEYDIQFPEGSILTVPAFPDYPAHGYSITGVSFKVKFNPPLVTEVVINAEDHIYMFMESLFDGRRFTITKDGEIIENTPWEDDPEARSTEFL